MYTFYVLEYDSPYVKTLYGNEHDARKLFDRLTDGTLSDVFHVSYYGPAGHVNSWNAQN